MSLSDRDGESDLVVVFEKADKTRFALLIEDKIDAQFQPDQLARYRQRGDSGIERGFWKEFEVALFAPRSYLDRHLIVQDFDIAFAYEDIASAICTTLSGRRGDYRADFISAAAPRGASAFVKVKDAATDAFWNSAYALAQAEFPELEMKNPDYAAGANWVIFRPQDIPTNIWTELKGGNGNVDLTFYGNSFEAVYEAASPLIEKDMAILRVGKSPAIRLKTPTFFVSEGADVIETKVRTGFSKSSRLISFYRKHRHAFLPFEKSGRKKDIH